MSAGRESRNYEESLLDRLRHACMQMIDPGKEYAIRMRRADWLWLLESLRSETERIGEAVDRAPSAEGNSAQWEEIAESYRRTANELAARVAKAESELERIRSHVLRSEPFGYMVVMDGGSGPIVGGYKAKELADLVCQKQPGGHNYVVLPIYTHGSFSLGAIMF